MKTKPQRPKGPGDTLSSLSTAIYTLDLARDTASVGPAKEVFGSASILLATLRVRSLLIHVGRLLTGTQDSRIEELDFVELGLTCAEVCQALDRGINGRQQEPPSSSALEAIERLKS